MAITGHMSAYPRIGEVVISAWKEAGLLKASTIAEKNRYYGFSKGVHEEVSSRTA